LKTPRFPVSVLLFSCYNPLSHQILNIEITGVENRLKSFKTISNDKISFEIEFKTSKCVFQLTASAGGASSFCSSSSFSSFFFFLSSNFFEEKIKRN